MFVFPDRPFTGKSHLLRYNSSPGRAQPRCGGIQSSEVAMATSTEHSAKIGTKWHDMTGSQKVTFFFKLVIALCTFGFVYPNVMSE